PRYIITSIFLTLICSQTAQAKQTKPLLKSNAPNPVVIKVYPARGKRIRIVAGAVRTIVDLTEDVSGCLALFDPVYHKRVMYQSLGIKVLDRVGKDDKSYLVLLTKAQSNCNVQGQCGADSDYTLIWLKLSASLKLEEKKAVIIEDCRSDVSLIE